MNEEQFSQLCRDTSFLLGQEDIDGLGKYGKITIQNSAVTVFFDEEIDSSEIVIYIEIVSLNNTNRESILAILMGMNLLNNQTLLGLCALDPIRNIAILKKNILAIDDLTSAQFAMILVDLTSYVNQLRAQLPELVSNCESSLLSKDQLLQSA
jgi:hypothetical protein